MRMPDYMPELYHFTCDHFAPRIQADGFLKPGPDGFVWLTDLDWPVPKALGLTRSILKCDRSKNRFHMTSGVALWWMIARLGVDPERVEALETAEGAMPAHWWVSVNPVEVDEL